MFSGRLINGQTYIQTGINATLHGWVLSICWCVLADIAIMFKFFRSFKYNMLVHGLLFTIIVIASIV
jgi:hypothetical protein